MIKAWNRTINGHFRSFHLEVLAWQIFDGVMISDYPSGARYFFDKGRHLISQPNLDPAGYGGDVVTTSARRRKLLMPNLALQPPTTGR